MFRSYQEERRAKQREWQRKRDAELADRFGEALGLDETPTPTIGFDFLQSNDQRDE